MKQTSSEFNPFPGPRPYSLEWSDFFYGRDSDSDRVLSICAASPLVVMYARSGVGKSSIIEVGLERANREHAFGVQIVAGPRLVPDAHDDVDWSSHLDDVLSEATARMRRCSVDKPSSCLLVLDQFEELYTPRPAPRRLRKKFLQGISNRLTGVGYRVLISIREDFLPSLSDDLRNWSGPHVREVRLQALTFECFDDVVKAPIVSAGGKIGLAALDELKRLLLPNEDLDEVDQRSSDLNLVDLQIVCRQLWERSHTNEIEQRTVRGLGDLSDVLRSFVVSGVASACAAGRVPKRRVHRWLATNLVTSGETRAPVYREEKYTAGMENSLVQALVRERILTYSERDGVTWCELAHDSLVGAVLDADRIVNRPLRSGRTIAVGFMAVVGIAAATAGPLLFDSPDPPDGESLLDALLADAGAPVLLSDDSQILESPVIIEFPQSVSYAVVVPEHIGLDSLLLFARNPLDPAALPSVSDDTYSISLGSSEGTEFYLRSEHVWSDLSESAGRIIAVDGRLFADEDSIGAVDLFVATDRVAAIANGDLVRSDSATARVIEITDRALVSIALNGMTAATIFSDTGELVSPIEVSLAESDTPGMVALAEYLLQPGQYLVLGRSMQEGQVEFEFDRFVALG